ncbi:MAG: fibronectin type III domain-containing protein [Bacteroidales bacterium]|nr:fibronectin type III domain-containing protein [Bacteroidales bacterium]
MRKLIYLLLFMLPGFFVNGQVVEIGTGTSTGSDYFPFYTFYENGKSQTLYFQSEIGGAFTIDKIGYNLQAIAASGYEVLTNLTINFKYTTATELTTGAYADMTGSTQVFFSPSYTLGSTPGWAIIDINDFAYNGTDNLIVEIIWGDEGAYSSTIYKNYKTTGTVNRTAYGYSDFNTPPGYSGISMEYSNIRFFGPLVCWEPSNFIVSNIDTYQAEFSWTAGGSETNWNIEYGPAGFAQGSGTTIAVTDNPYTLTGLSADTDYQIYIQSDCSGYESLWIGPFDFTTLPTCPAPTDFTANYYDSDEVQLSWTGGGASTWNLEYGPTGFAIGTGTYVADVSNPVTISGLVSETTYDFYVQDYCGVGDESVWVGPVTITTTDACPTPINVAASNITGVSADITWTGFDGTAFDIEYGASPFTPTGTPTIEDVAPSTYNITGLNPVTNYSVYIRNDCGAEQSAWVGPINFTTPCADFVPSYFQDYASFLPECWSKARGQLANPTSFTESTSYWIADGFGNVGSTGAARINIYSTNRFEWMISPSIDLGDGSIEYQLEFDMAYTVYAGTGSATLGTDDKIAVVISTDNGLTWNLADALEVWDNSSTISNTGEHRVYNLSGYTGVVKFGFYGESTVSDVDNDFFIDNFWVRQVPTCMEPSAFSVDYYDSDEATVSWTTGGAANWNIEYGPSGFTPGTGTLLLDVSNPATITGLSAETAYDFYVQDSCAVGDVSLWIGPLTITTTEFCPAPISFTGENITSSSVDLSWTGFDGTAFDLEYGIDPFTPTGIPTIYNVGVSPYTLSGLLPATTYSVYIRNYCSTDSSAWVGPFTFTTECEDFIPSYLQNFDTYLPVCWSEAKGQIADPTTFTSTISNWGVDGFANIGSTGAARVNVWSTNHYEWIISPNIDLGDGSIGYQLEFDMALTNYAGTAATTLGTDDKIVVAISTDAGATWNLADALEVFTSASTISNTGEHHVYDLSAYTGVVKFAFYTESTISDADNDFFIDNFWVRKIPTCFEPTNFAVDYYDADEAQLSWTTGGSANWNIEYGPSGFTPGTGTLLEDVSNPATISGLSAETAYDFYVQDSCGVGDVGLFIGPLTITTPANCPSPIDVTSYGITDTEATIAWNGFDATEWDIEYGISPFTPTGTPSIENTTSNPFTFTGLTGETTYDFYLRADCSSETSEWTGPFQFTTLMTPLTNPTACGVNMAFGPNNLTIPILVDAASGTQLGTDVMIREVNVIIQHDFDADVEMYLESPSGVMIDLSVGNGGGNYDYGIIDGTCSHFTNFIMCAPTSISSGIAPFVGSYIPDGDFADFNDGSDPNGVWILHLIDNYPSLDDGSLQFVELVFGLESSEADFVSFSFPTQTAPATIDYGSNNVDISVGFGTDISNLVASFTLTSCAYAEISSVGQISGVTTNDFSLTVTYTIFAEDGTSEDWTVNVTVSPVLSETDIITYSFAEQTAPAVIDPINHTVNINVNWMADITNLIANFTLSYGANATIAAVPQVSGLTSNDFTLPVTYLVTAEDAVTTQDWIVTVTQDAAPEGSSCDYGLEAFVGLNAADNSDYEQWFYFNPPQSGVATIYSCGLASIDTWLYVYGDCDSVATMAHIAENDDGCSLQSTVTLTVSSDSTYLILWDDAYVGGVFNFMIDLTPYAADLGIQFPDANTTTCGLGDSELLYCEIHNTGEVIIPANDTIIAIADFDSGYHIEDTIIVATDVNPGEFIGFVFSETIDLSALTTYNFVINIIYDGDANYLNDSVVGFIEHYELSVQIAGGDTIHVASASLPYGLTTVGGFFNYFWHNADYSITGTTAIFPASAYGWYYVDVTDVNGCTATDSVLIDFPVTTELPINISELEVYPNPSNGEFTLKMGMENSKDVNISIINTLGQEIWTKDYSNINTINENIALKNVSDGIYKIQIKTPDDLFTKKIVIQKR